MSDAPASPGARPVPPAALGDVLPSAPAPLATASIETGPIGPARGVVERARSLGPDDMSALCEATDAAIIEGGGFGWVASPGRLALERYFRGVLLVPDRELFLARLDGVVVGAAQLVRPPRNNEAQAFAATLMHAYVAPYARGVGLARMMTLRVEEGARSLGFQVLNLDVRETQTAAISLYEGLGYQRWGMHPSYARVGGRTVRGFFYCKMLQRDPVG